MYMYVSYMCMRVVKAWKFSTHLHGAHNSFIILTTSVSNSLHVCMQFLLLLKHTPPQNSKNVNGYAYGTLESHTGRTCVAAKL